MPLSEITNPHPITIPASTEKLFASAYIVGLQLITLDETGSKQRLRVTLRPYNQGDNEVYRGENDDFSLDINDLWTEAARAPLLAQVIASIVNITNLLLQERDLIVKLSTAGEADRPTWEQQLAAVQTELGIQ